MKLKEIESVMVGITNNGKIVLDQTTTEANFIYLTIDQFRKIVEWVANNEHEIEELWNDGIAIEGDANED